jgi:hypothetical protein
MNDWTLPTSAEDLAAYVERVGGIHLHFGSGGWRLAHIETGKCGTSECAKFNVRRDKKSS